MTGPLISAEQLARRLDGDTRVVDVRWYLQDPGLGRRRYASAHLPGAVFLDLDTDLSDTTVEDAGRHPLPDRETLAGLLGRLGIGNQHTVVAYDDSGGAIAARLWWLLRWLGHADVAVLDGGWRAWTDAGLPTTPDVPEHPPASFTIHPPLTKVVDRSTVQHRGDSVLYDARAPERYFGEVEPVDPIAGRIPGAVNIPTATLLGPGGRFLPPEELATTLGPTTEQSIASCGSGVTACAVILAAVAAGLPEPALFPGSYSEWSRAGLPVASGPSASPL
jgi:thiosulfate/3-mercaptopyruvate sulfurtransferase